MFYSVLLSSMITFYIYFYLFLIINFFKYKVYFYSSILQIFHSVFFLQ